MELKEWGGSSRLVDVNGSPLHVQGIVLVHLTLSKNVVFENKFLVVEGMTVEAILGLDFLETFKCMIDSGDRKISFPNEKLVLPLLDVNQKVSKTVGLFIQRKLTIPAESEVEVMVDIASGGVGDNPVVGTWLVERGSTVPLRVFNPHKEAVRLWKGLEIAQMEPLDKDPPISSDTHLLTISAVTEVSPSEAQVFTLIWDAQTSQSITLTQVTLNPSINCPVVSPQPAARKQALNFNQQMCKLCQKEVRFLGHVISENGIATDPEKTAVIATWPVPESKKNIQQFLGLANYYRRFIKDFGTTAKSLQRLLEKNIAFEWTQQCQGAFDHLRTSCWTLMQVIRVLVQFCPKYRTIGGEAVIAYASRSLSRQEQRYCVTRRELLAVVEFIHHFRHYLLGVHFTLRTDHGSLVWIQNFKEPEGQLARWLERLQEYTFTVVHRPGNQHTNVDALSRVPCNQCGRVTHVYSPSHLAAQIGIVSQGHSAADVHDQQLNDSSIGPVLKAKERGATPNLDEVKTWSRESRQLVQMWSSLKVDNSVLWRLCIDGRSQHLQLVLPSVVRESVLQDLHSGSMGGHVGESKMIHLVRERYYWPGWKESVKEWCRKCRTCSTRKMAPPSKRAPLQTLQAGYPLQIVAVDILGPLPVTAQGNKYVLVACDCFTRWVEVYAIQNQEALTVAEMLVDEMFCRFSPPEQLHSDQGRQFEADLLKEVCTLLQIHKTRTTAYHPHCNGLVERFNRTLLDMLSTTVKDHKMNWDQCIRRVCLAYNSSVHASTGYSPFYLMYGRQVNLPVDLMYGSTPHEACTLGDYAHTLRNNLTEAYVLARRKGITEHNRQKALYDVKVHGAPYQVGDWVWLHSPAVPRGQCTRTETFQGPPPENPDENEALLEFAPVGSNIHVEVLDGIGEQVPQELLPHEEPAEDEAAHADQPAEVQHRTVGYSKAEDNNYTQFNEWLDEVVHGDPTDDDLDDIAHHDSVFDYAGLPGDDESPAPPVPNTKSSHQ
eukprot:Em0001g2224a